jgi:hypothetical protein
LGAISQMKNLLLIGLILLTFACGEKQRQLTEPTDSLTQADTIKFEKADNIISNENCHTWLTDSILSTGDFVNYIKDNGKVKIEWGNKNFKRTFNQDYSCTGAPSWIPTIEWTTKTYIGLNYGCGSPCWGTIILPLNPTDSVIERMYDFDQDIERNLIVYLGTKDYNVLTIENWKTGKKQEINSKINCEPAFFGYCIDSLKLYKDRLFVQWSNGDEKKTTTDNIKLEL